MSDETQNPIARKTVVYQMPGMEAVTVQRDIEYKATASGALTMDLYYPPDSKSGGQTPAVIIVAGFPDFGFQKMFGCKFKEMGSSTSWAQLIAASGLVAITYTNQEPATDIRALLEYVRLNSAALGIDENRIGIWASSGHSPVALSVLMQEPCEYLKCAVLCYGYMLDLDGSTSIAKASKMFRFENPNAGKTVSDIPDHIPLFIVRAGQDQTFKLNETIDSFIANALICNLTFTVLNHAAAPHAFDLLQDSDVSREVIKQILAFMQFHLAIR